MPWERYATHCNIHQHVSCSSLKLTYRKSNVWNSVSCMLSLSHSINQNLAWWFCESLAWLRNSNVECSLTPIISYILSNPSPCQQILKPILLIWRKAEYFRKKVRGALNRWSYNRIKFKLKLCLICPEKSQTHKCCNLWVK